MQLPVIKPLSFVIDAIEAMLTAGARLTIPQRINLALLVSSMILLRTLTLSQICLGLLYKRSISFF